MAGTRPTATIMSMPPSGFTPIGNVFTVDFTADLGTVILATGLAATRTITGLLTTDQVLVQCISVLPLGVSIGNARVSATNTLEVRLITSVVAGVSLGSLSYRVTVFR